MKRLWTLALSLVLALSLGGNALAATSVDLIRAFVYGDTLYTYVDITGNEAPITKAEASIGTQTFAASGNLETVRQAGSPILYLLLLDASTSMPGFQEDIAAYAQALAQTAGENTRFLLSTFGESFTLLSDDVAPEELGELVEAVSYTETSSRLLGGIHEALNYLEALPRTGNELRDIVILSDAVEYDDDGSVSYDDLLTHLTASDAMLHSVGFGGDETAQGSLAALAEASGGQHWSIGDSLTAAAAAEDLAAYNGGLYVTSFSLAGYNGGNTEDVSVTFASGAELVCRAQAAVAFPGDGGTAEDPAAQETPAEALPPEASSPAPSPTASAGSSQEDNGFQLPPMVVRAGIGIAVVLVVVLLAVLLTRQGRKKGKAAPASAPEAPPAPDSAAGGIYVRLEVLQGVYIGKTQEFNLIDELVIGRDAACSIVFDDPSISRRNTRVFLAGGVVYVEDLGSHNGTAVNGVPIQMPSILRSGDEIALGDTVLRLKF